MLRCILRDRTLVAAGVYGRWSAYLCLALLVYMASYFAGVSSHFSNNLFYGLVGVPTIAFLIVRRSEALGALRRYWPLWLMFSLAVLSETFAPEGSPLGVARAAAYLLVLALALHVAAGNPRLMTIVFVLYGCVAVVFGIAAIGKWSAGFISTAHYLRVQLTDLNVTRTSLLALFGVFALWLFALEPFLAARRAVLLKGAAFASVTGFCVALALVFQSRSSIVALILFLFAYGLFERRLRLVSGVVLGIAALLMLSGLYEVLLQRGGSYRSEIWADVVRRLFADCSVITGCGSGGNYRFIGQFNNPHSGYLATLYYHGVGTLVAFVMLLVWAARRGWRDRNPFVLLSIIGLGGAVASSPGFIDSPEPQWVYFWVPLMLVLNGYRPVPIPGTGRDLPCSKNRPESEDR